jgi:hypothetical protein
MYPGPRYHEWKRTGVLPPISRAGIWMLLAAAGFCMLVWWFSR